MMKTKVAVVGAGIAGISAAAKLIHNGIEDVVVLEAETHVGGRCHAVLHGGKPLDMGAMFIHGTHGNPLYEVANKLGKVIKEEREGDEYPVNIPKFFYTTKREKIAYSDVKDLVNCLEESMDSKAQGLESKGQLMLQHYQQYLQKHSTQIAMDPSKKELYDAVFRWFSVYEGLDEGTDTLDQIVMWSLNCYNKLKGNHYTLVEGGFTTIIEALMKLLPNGVVKTGMPVTHIDWGRRNGGTESMSSVRCTNGDVFYANHVIITMSLGCIKATHKEVFHPPLPNTFLNVIDHMEQGAIGKVFLKWDKPVWNTDEDSKEILWLDSYPLTLKSDVSKRKTSLGTDWWQISNVEKVEGHDNLLLFWLLKPQIDVINQLEEREVMAVFHELMQHVFFDIDIPPPKAIYRTNWVENPYTRGTYSYVKPSFDKSNITYIDSPIPSSQNPKLLFAGEAFKLEFMTTTHGAFVSGEEQADKVLKANGITDTIAVVDLVK